MTTRYVDFEGGNDSNNGSSFALRKKTLSSATSGLTSGDTLRVMASLDPTSLSQNATFTNASDTVTLTTAVTANIDTCESAWTASANVTATATSSPVREGTNAASLEIASGFTTGLVAYHTMSLTDFSAYKQISLLIRANNDIAASTLTLSLCTDTIGAVATNTIAIPAITGGYWTTVTVDTGGALSSLILSVALNALLDPGTVTIYLDNIIACKDSTSADSLTHSSLLGKNTGTEPWMAIDSINGTTIKLAGGYQSQASRSSVNPYYYGTTATQTIYKREPIVGATQTASSGNGSNLDNTVNIECGWDRTAMSSQSGQTFYRLQDPGASNGVFNGSGVTNHYLNKWYSINSGNTSRAGIFIGDSWVFGEIGAIACTTGFRCVASAALEAISNSTRYTIACLNAFFFTNSVPVVFPNEVRLRFNYMWGYSSSSSDNLAINDALTLQSGNCRLLVYNCDIQGHYASFGNSLQQPGVFSEIKFQNCNLKNITRDVYCGYPVYFINTTIDGGVTNYPTYGARNYYINQGADTTSHKIVPQSPTAGLGIIQSATDQRHTASDFSWKFVNTVSGNSYGANWLSVAKVACVASEQRTVKLWFRRDSTSLTMRLRVKGGLVAGIDDDITTNMTAAINTWEQVTIQFTPTQQCVVEVFAEAYGATANGWVDDLSVA